MLELARLVAVVSIGAVLGGCAFSAEAPVVVKPELVTNQSSIGTGKAVRVSVVDQRPSKVLGTRGVRGVGSELTAADNLTGAILDSVSEGLRKEGFAIATDSSSDASDLRIELRDLEYNVTMGFWAGTLRTQCALNAVCRVPQKEPYQKLFRGEHEESVQVVQSADANVRYINDAVSKAITELVDDPELGQCLATPHVPNTANAGAAGPASK